MPYTRKSAAERQSPAARITQEIIRRLAEGTKPWVIPKALRVMLHRRGNGSRIRSTEAGF
jgi:antirestriction protein ArdC